MDVRVELDDIKERFAVSILPDLEKRTRRFEKKKGKFMWFKRIRENFLLRKIRLVEDALS